MPSYWHKDTHSVIKGLTNKNPSERLKLADIKRHAFFKSIFWAQLLERKTSPPYVPSVPKGELDVSNFDEMYTNKSVAADNWSTGPVLSRSQDKLFEGFSFSRSFTPPPDMPTNGVVDVSGIQSELSAEIFNLARDAAPDTAVHEFAYDIQFDTDINTACV